MQSLKFALSLIASMIFASTVWAQSTTDIIRDTVFSEVEKRIIGEHFGVDMQDIVKDDTMPEWAVKSDEPEGHDDDRDDDEESDRKKDKGKKDKGKGKKDKAKGKSKGLPPGLAKRDSLPPGLQKQLDKNGRLPKGLAKRDLPDDLAGKMPKRDDSQDVTVVDDDVVLIDKTTGVILDVIKDVVRGKSGAVKNPDGTLAAPGPQDQGAEAVSGGLGAILKNIFGGN